MTLSAAIDAAEKILPGQAAPEGEQDARWQAIIEVSEFIESNPSEVWEFAARWGCSDDTDLRMAIATCVLEHLLEYHFDFVFPRVEQLAQSNLMFADTLSRCSEFGQSLIPANRARLRAIRKRVPA